MFPIVLEELATVICSLENDNGESMMYFHILEFAILLFHPSLEDINLSGSYING
ncbi:14585_t:CDS:1, partial [Entrophospora sp. SA101]